MHKRGIVLGKCSAVAAEVLDCEGIAWVHVTDDSAARSGTGSFLDYQLLELTWLAEILRSHQEAIAQLDALPPDKRGALVDEPARRQMVLGSEGFTELMELMVMLGHDVARHREEKDSVLPEARIVLENAINSRLEIVRDRMVSLKFLLDSI